MVATDKVPPRSAQSRTDDDRSLRQLANVRTAAGIPSSVLDIPVVKDQIHELIDFLPLHQVDLSGYGLSTFSDWRRDVPVGVTQVRFDVMNGRTSLEVIQVRTILAPCEAPPGPDHHHGAPQFREGAAFRFRAGCRRRRSLREARQVRQGRRHCIPQDSPHSGSRQTCH